MFQEIIEKCQPYKWYLALAGGVLIIGLSFFFFLTPAQGQEELLVSAVSSTVVSSESEETTTSTTAQELVVDVKGAVANPGVYQLATDARVQDAIDAAGGLSKEADRKSINLAQKLTDEAVVYVATVDEQVSVVSASTPASTSGQTQEQGDKSELINLNTATAADLQTISGIGEKRANDIITYREENGGFQSVDDLKEVSGIGEKTLETIRPYVTVD